MKKGVIVLFFLTLIFLNNKKEEFIIPEDAIRFRIIANSNTFEDQATKMEIKNNIENMLQNELPLITDKKNAKNYLTSQIPEIKNMLGNYDIKYNINYGNNYFPEKRYKGVTYKEGYYESLVVTLGEGAGDNWWCLLFPPLCLMEEQPNMKDVDYQFFVKDVFHKYK